MKDSKNIEDNSILNPTYLKTSNDQNNAVTKDGADSDITKAIKESIERNSFDGGNARNMSTSFNELIYHTKEFVREMPIFLERTEKGLNKMITISKYGIQYIDEIQKNLKMRNRGNSL